MRQDRRISQSCKLAKIRNTKTIGEWNFRGFEDSMAPMSVWMRYLGWIMALLSGGMAVLAFPPHSQDAAGWFCLIPLVCAVRFGWADWRHGWAAGITFWLGTMWWLAHVTTLGMLLLCLYLAGYWAAWCALLRPVMTRYPEATTRANLVISFVAATGWVGLDAVRAWLLSGFPWNGLGVSQFENLGMIQIARLGGVELVTWLVIFANMIGALTIIRFYREMRRSQKLRPHFDFSICMALIAAAFAWGIGRVWSKPERARQSVKVGIVQGNIPQELKFDPAEVYGTTEKYVSFTSFLAGAGTGASPDLILWPETATGTGVFQDRALTQAVADLMRGARFSLLLGSVELWRDAYYNSAILFLPKEGGYKAYKKQRLVPFGEFIPFRRWMPWLGNLAGLPGDYRAGDGSDGVLGAPTASGQARLGLLICFEDTLPALARSRVKDGAELLVNLTNDGWFRDSPGAWLHVANAIFRCIETGLPMVRCANTGVSCIIEPTGRIAEILRDGQKIIGVQGAFVRDVAIPQLSAQTPYVRWGHLFPLCCLALTACYVAYEFARNRDRRRAAKPIRAAQEVSLTSRPSGEN